MPDTITPRIGLTKPEVGGSSNSWGNKLNANMDILDQKGVFNTTQWSTTFGDGNPASTAGPFIITRYNNSGVAQDNPIVIDRQTGDVTLADKLNVTKDAAFAMKVTVTGVIEGTTISMTGNIATTAQVSAVGGFVANNNVPASKAFEAIQVEPGSGLGPFIELYRDSVTPVANDGLGAISLYGKNAAGTKTLFAQLASQILDTNVGSEDGALMLQAMVNGALQTLLTAKATGVDVSALSIAGVPVLANVPVPTRQKLVSGTAATYNTPAGCRQLRIRMVGGGGGGGSGSGSGGVGVTGGATIFNAIQAAGGSGGRGSGGALEHQGGAGGTGGTGAASHRQPGAPGGSLGASGSVDVDLCGGLGGSSPLGGGGLGAPRNGSGLSAAANTGGGGGGGNSGNGGSGGGGSGEYVELIINNPAANYTYTIGAGGVAGSTSGGGGIAGDGGSGVIIVDELY